MLIYRIRIADLGSQLSNPAEREMGCELAARAMPFSDALLGAHFLRNQSKYATGSGAFGHEQRVN